MKGSFALAMGALENLGAQVGVTVNINTVINRFNADHLDENVRFFVERFPFLRHFVWNNLDPSMGRAETNRDTAHRLADFELSLARAMRFLAQGRAHVPRRARAALLHDRVRALLDRDAQDRQGRGAHRALPRREGHRAADRLRAPQEPRRARAAR